MAAGCAADTGIVRAVSQQQQIAGRSLQLFLHVRRPIKASTNYCVVDIMSHQFFILTEKKT